jgi:hypothetical protein
MEAQVIPLDSRRKKKPVDYGPQFYCLRCDKAEFVLYASGAVHCKPCGALMKNLFITKYPEAS